MKKWFAMLLAVLMVVSLAACTQTTPTAAPTTKPTTAPTAKPTEAPTEAPVKVMTYEEYAAAPIESEVVVETYVQAKQSWWDNKGTFYTQDENGGYYLYNMTCTQEEYNKLVPGTKIRVTGFKSEWAGEVEITDAAFEILEGSYIAEPAEVSANDAAGLEQHMNQLVTFKRMTVEAMDDGAAFNYKNAEEKSDDLYFRATNGDTINFCVEFYLTGKDTDVYKAVEGLKVGDTVDVTCFMYWYNGPNPHVISVTPAEQEAKGEGVMTYEEFAAAPLESEVTVETYVQAFQSWYNGKIKLYTQDDVGGYYIYDMACSQEDAAKLTPGTKIRVKGYKSAWAGEVEITDATYEILEGTYVAPAKDISSLVGETDLEEKMNQYVAFRKMVVAAYDEEGNAIRYKNAQEKTDDIYFKASLNGEIIEFCVEFYLTGKDTAVYKAVEQLQVGQVIDVEAFLYWYNGPNPHVYAISAEAPEEKSAGVMTYAEYAGADIDAEVTVETYVQAKQSWYQDKGTFYTQDQEGGYYLYNMPCSKEEYDKLVPGTKIRVKGFKAAWAGEVEIVDTTFEIVEGSEWIAEPVDLTALIGTDLLEQYQNRFFSMKGLTIVAQDDGAAFNYKNAEQKTDDLYFKATLGDKEISLCVEFYLCGKDTDVYKAVEGLKVGDKVDIEGFLYWYNGANPHVTSLVTAE
ncbi:MAG: hypothetical protein J5794_05760 [Lachnospiraceae bacterium]|nr:hypothetical protein [Lachnospiraceae bacterium]